MNKLDTLLSKILDGISDYVSAHRGVPVLIGVLRPKEGGGVLPYPSLSRYSLTGQQSRRPP